MIPCQDMTEINTFQLKTNNRNKRKLDSVSQEKQIRRYIL